MLLSKSEFARRRGVSPAAVSQWIGTQRLSGAALVGEGRTAKIDVEEAERQLGQTLDLGQQMAQQTLRPTASAAQPALQRLPEDDHAARYQKARADSAEIEAERARRREQAERGVYMETDQARAAWARELGALITGVDQWINDLALGLAAETGQDPKSLTVFLRQRWRDFRQKRTDLQRQARDADPHLVDEAASPEDEIDGDEEDPQSEDDA